MGKQGRLPFAPVNNKTPKAEVTDSGRKRKLSEENNVTPNKTLKKDTESKTCSNKSSKEISTKTDETEVADSKENKPDEVTTKISSPTKELKPKEIKKKSRKSVETQEKNESIETAGRADKFYGLLKMPFKKQTKKDKPVDLDENSVELLMDTSVLEDSA